MTKAEFSATSQRASTPKAATERPRTDTFRAISAKTPQKLKPCRTRVLLHGSRNCCAVSELQASPVHTDKRPRGRYHDRSSARKRPRASAHRKHRPPRELQADTCLDDTNLSQATRQPPRGARSVACGVGRPSALSSRVCAGASANSSVTLGVEAEFSQKVIEHLFLGIGRSPIPLRPRTAVIYGQ